MRTRFYIIRTNKWDSVDDGANSARNRECGVLAAEVDRREDSRGGWGRGEEDGGWVVRGWLQLVQRGKARRGKGGRRRRQGGERNFARARLHPPRPPPPPPLDAEGSWTARVRCQFCARSPPWRCQPARDLLQLVCSPKVITHAFPTRLSRFSLFFARVRTILWNGPLSEKFEGHLFHYEGRERGESYTKFESGTWHSSAGADYHAGRDLRGQQCTWKFARGRKLDRMRVAFFFINVLAQL